jgi:hypothetical protein
MMSIKAKDRELELWYKRIKDGEIKLPRFQRFEAWDKWRISSLLNNIVHNLPLGITLILEIGKDEEFLSRYIATAEIIKEIKPKVFEHLLDGQQRLTAIWRALNNNYSTETYFLYIREYDIVWEKEEDDDEELGTGVQVYGETRWKKKDESIMPRWADDPEECFKRGCIPIQLLRPEDIGPEKEDWINKAIDHRKPKSGADNYEHEIGLFYQFKSKLMSLIDQYRETVKHYNLPYLALPSDTPKQVALNVFINMNTNSKPLSQYDIIVAEIEGLKDQSLHDLQSKLDADYPGVKNYFDLSYLILNTSALIQDKIPNNRGIWDMDKKELVANWDKMSIGLDKMSQFLKQHKIFDEYRLPTNAVLAVLAALFTHIPEKGDRAGAIKILLKKYLWSSFFTFRYEKSAASRAYMDYSMLKNIITGKQKTDNSLYTEIDVPVLNRSQFPLSTVDELLNVIWPKYVTIRGRGILAVANYCGALDFADGSPISETNISKREYHHIFPDALIEEANEHLDEPLRSSVALNCALITDTTNRNIGRKEPLAYLKERYQWATETIINQRLQSHLIPKNELAAGSYEGLNGIDKAHKIKNDFDSFIAKRAKLIHNAVQRLAQGEEVYAADIISNELGTPASV